MLNEGAILASIQITVAAIDWWHNAFLSLWISALPIWNNESSFQFSGTWVNMSPLDTIKMSVIDSESTFQISQSVYSIFLILSNVITSLGCRQRSLSLVFARPHLLLSNQWEIFMTLQYVSSQWWVELVFFFIRKRCLIIVSITELNTTNLKLLVNN